MGRNLHRLLQPLPGHEDPEKGVRGRGDGEGGVLGVHLVLEGDEVVGVALHLRQPVDKELVGLLVGEAQGGQGPSRKAAVSSPGTTKPSEKSYSTGEMPSQKRQ